MRDERDRMSASGVVELDKKPSANNRPRRQTFDVGPGESTQVVWRPRTKKKRALVPIVAAAIIGVVVIGAAVALLLFNSTSEDPGQATSEEDPLALYQVATELYEQGEHNAALQMLRRARVVTTHSRAHRQLDELERKIQTALNTSGDGQPGQPSSASRTPQATANTSVSGTSTTTGAAVTSKKPRSGRTTRSRSRTRTASRSRGVGMVYVESDAVGDVLVDGRPTGSRTPTTLSLSPGLHTVEVVPLIDPSLRMVRQVNVSKGQSGRLRLTINKGTPKPTPKPADKRDDMPQPAIGTVSQTKPAIGTVGANQPTIGIMKSE